MTFGITCTCFLEGNAASNDQFLAAFDKLLSNCKGCKVKRQIWIWTGNVTLTGYPVLSVLLINLSWRPKNFENRRGIHRDISFRIKFHVKKLKIWLGRISRRKSAASGAGRYTGPWSEILLPGKLMVWDVEHMLMESWSETESKCSRNLGLRCGTQAHA